jgi:hypothetical protein
MTGSPGESATVTDVLSVENVAAAEELVRPGTVQRRECAAPARPRNDRTP